MKLKELFEGDVIKGNFGKKKEPEKKKSEPEVKFLTKGEKLPKGATEISMTKAFGSEQLGILEDAKIKLAEKPGYWSELDSKDYDYAPISKLTFKRAQAALKKSGYVLKTYTTKELYGSDPKSPQVSPIKMPKEKMIIVEFSNGTRYIADTTGANTYIRNWAKIA